MFCLSALPLLHVRQLIGRQRHAGGEEIGEEPGGAGAFVGALAVCADGRGHAAAMLGIVVRRDEALEAAAGIHEAARMAASEKAQMCSTSSSMVGGWVASLG